MIVIHNRHRAIANTKRVLLSITGAPVGLLIVTILGEVEITQELVLFTDKRSFADY